MKTVRIDDDGDGDIDIQLYCISIQDYPGRIGLWRAGVPPSGKTRDLNGMEMVMVMVI